MYGDLIKDIEVDEDDLSGFEEDVFQWLHDCKYFSNIHVEITTDIECLISASLNYQADIDEAWVAEELRRIWENKIRYRFFEKHNITNQDGVITLDFFTRTQQHSYTGEQAAVTGKIVASP